MNKAFKPAAHGPFNTDIIHCDADGHSYLKAEAHLNKIDVAHKKAEQAAASTPAEPALVNEPGSSLVISMDPAFWVSL